VADNLDHGAGSEIFAGNHINITTDGAGDHTVAVNNSTLAPGDNTVSLAKIAHANTANRGKVLGFSQGDGTPEYQDSGKPGASIWWMAARDGTAQTERLPTTQPSLLNSIGLARFSGGTADETFNGGIGTVTWSNTNADSNHDNSSADLANSVFQLPAGTYHIKGTFYTNLGGSTLGGAGLIKLQTGTDDTIVAVSPGNTSTPALPGIHGDIDAAFLLNFDYLTVLATDKYYIRFAASATTRASGYIQFVEA
jgi:hypothetical protein